MNLQTMANQIELWLLDKLIPYARNPRTHSDAQVAQIAASIREFGFNIPDLGGYPGRRHCRPRASSRRPAVRARTVSFRVIILDHLSEMQKRAYIIADNQLTLNAGWDDDSLRQQLSELRDADFGLEALGFADDELRELLVEAEQDSTRSDEEEIPETSGDAG